MSHLKHIEFTALILAATSGARLYPLTTTKNDIHSSDTSEAISTYMPKHMLPIAGRPILHHLVDQCLSSGLSYIIIAIGAEDDITQDSLVSDLGCTLLQSSNSSTTISELKYHNMDVIMVRMLSDCSGSADAFRFIDKQGIVPVNSHLIVLPSDLVLYGHLSSNELNGTNALSSLVDMHRREFRDSKEKGGMPLAMSMILSDVGEEDENGVPLKESAKAKKGGIAREEEEIEYIGISTIRIHKNTSLPPTQRIILKQSKYNVEMDEHNTGSTPKLYIPKARLHSPMNQIMIKTVWNDMYLFCFSPWALKLLSVKEHIKEIGKEFVPFLVDWQFRGVLAAFGVTESSENLHEDITEAIIKGMGDLNVSKDIGAGSNHGLDDGYYDLMDAVGGEDRPFLVAAHILSRDESKLMVRACTIPAYLYISRELVSHAITTSKYQEDKDSQKIDNSNTKLIVPKGTTINTKFNTINLPDSSIGDKVQAKSCTIGRGVKVGGHSRLNNVVIHDNVTIGENCVLQNSVLSAGCIVGSNSNLNDCQVRCNANLPSGTKLKGEGY